MSSSLTSIKAPTFDQLSFIHYSENIGRPYRRHAVELISISRIFAQQAAQEGWHEQRFPTDDGLRSILQVVDDALHSAAMVGKKTSMDVDRNFKTAIEALSAYERRQHLNTKTLVAERMRAANEMDISNWKVSKRLKETFRPLKIETTKIVEFILHESLLDKNPTIVKQVLSRSSNVNEIMWNFSLFRNEKRLTLRQNPQFYRRLPTKCGGMFRIDPTKTFFHDQISVLADNTGQSDRSRLVIHDRKRVFCKVLDARDTIIFQDISGRLEGERIFVSVIQDTALDQWRLEGFPRSRPRTSLEDLPSHRFSLSEYDSRFHILSRQTHALLAGACLSVLHHLDDHIDSDNIQNFPMALYAVKNWVDHAMFGNISSDLRYAIRRLLGRNRPHLAAWLWLYGLNDPFKFFKTFVSAIPCPVLHYAALCGYRGLAEHLVDAHSQDLNSRSGTRGTPLHAALDRGHQSVALLLLERGADICCLDAQSRTPLHSACRGCTDVVSVLIDHGVNLNAEDDNRETPLHIASQWGRDDIMRLLLLGHDADADHVDVGGWTPLHVASHEGHDKIVQLLFDHGVDANRPDNGGWTPLHLASWEGHEHVVRSLLDHGINVDHADNGGWTSLHAASQEGHNRIVELLLSHGADPNHANSDGSTSLHLAVQRDHPYIVQLLLDHGTDSNYPNSDGSTSLHLASQRSHYTTLQSLLYHGADANRLDGDGWTSLHLASRRGHYGVVGLLLDHGVDSNHTHMNGLTSLHLASQEGHAHIVRLLLDHGADPNTQNGDGCTPLYLASQGGHDHTVRLLLEGGADSDYPNSDSLTPIGFASREGCVERKPPKGFTVATRKRWRM